MASDYRESVLAELCKTADPAEYTIMGVPLPDVPDDLLRGLLAVSIKHNQQDRANASHSFETMRSIHKAHIQAIGRF